MKIIDKPELGALVSPQGNQYIPIHNWYPYKHGYSRGLATYLIKTFDLSAGAWVLDPFCGGGTTLLTCKELGINACGFDILPFSVFLSNVKVGSYDGTDLKRELNTLKRKNTATCSDIASLPDIPIIKKAFTPDIEKALLTLKSKIDYISDPNTRDFFNLAFLSILESVSNTSKTGGFLRIVKRDISPELIQQLFFKKASSMLNDIMEDNKPKQHGKVSVTAKVGDARKLTTKRKFDAVITSPPYPNRHDYTRIYSLEMMFDFVSNNGQLKKIRYETIRSHVEARKKYEAIGYKKPDALEFLIAQVKKKKKPQVLIDKADVLAEQVGCPLVLKKVKVLPQDLSRPQAQAMDSQLFTTDADEFFATPGIDIVVEAIGGESPAVEYLSRALSAGKHVVTSNKEVIAKHGVELLTLTQQHGVGLHYEAAVGGGIPLISPFQRDLLANNISGIYAIINGTTNFILTRMARDGVDFSSALNRAQELGYAEPNPRDDVEGIDATYKLAILASLAFHSQVRPEDIYHEGISRLDSRDFQYAQELGFAIKLLAIAKQSDESIEVRVHPVFIPEDSLLAKVDGVYNAILVEGDLVGKVLFFGEGAGALPTSSAVIADVVAAAQDVILGIGSKIRWGAQPGKGIKPMSEIKTRYYLRLNVADRPGVLAQIAKLLGDQQISISSVIQKVVDSVAQTAEIVIMTHPAQEKAMQQALGELTHLAAVNEISNFIRVEA